MKIGWRLDASCGFSAGEAARDGESKRGFGWVDGPFLNRAILGRSESFLAKLDEG